MTKPLEQQIKREIMAALGQLPFVLVVNSPAGKVPVRRGWMHCAPKGWPDLSGLVQCHSGRARPFYLETKTEVGKLSGDQKAMHERIRALGGYVGIARSVDQAVIHVAEARKG